MYGCKRTLLYKFVKPSTSAIFSNVWYLCSAISEIHLFNVEGAFAGTTRIGFFANPAVLNNM